MEEGDEFDKLLEQNSTSLDSLANIADMQPSARGAAGNQVPREAQSQLNASQAYAMQMQMMNNGTNFNSNMMRFIHQDGSNNIQAQNMSNQQRMLLLQAQQMQQRQRMAQQVQYTQQHQQNSQARANATGQAQISANFQSQSHSDGSSIVERFLNNLRLLVQKLPSHHRKIIEDNIQLFRMRQITHKQFIERITQKLGDENIRKVTAATRAQAMGVGGVSSRPHEVSQEGRQSDNGSAPSSTQSSPNVAKKKKLQANLPEEAQKAAKRKQDVSAPSAKRQRGTASGSGGITLPDSSKPEQSKEVDVLKMDAGSLQDVIQYAGVDLKAESELIMGTAESSAFEDSQRRAFAQSLSSIIQHDRILPPQSLSKFMIMMCKYYGIRRMEQECINFLWISLVKRAKQLISGSIEASKQRLEIGRDYYKLELVDGEDAVKPIQERMESQGMSADVGYRSRIGSVKRPLVWLERFDRKNEANIAIKLRGSVSEEGQIAYMESGIENIEEEEGDTEEDRRRKSALREREDVVVRARMTNEAALRAAGLGGGKYSWMTQASSGAAGSASALEAKEPPSTAPKDKPAKEIITMGGFGLPKPSQRLKQLKTRKVLMNDLLHVLRWDSTRGGCWGRLKKSKAVQSALFRVKPDKI